MVNAFDYNYLFGNTTLMWQSWQIRLQLYSVFFHCEVGFLIVSGIVKHGKNVTFIEMRRTHKNVLYYNNIYMLPNDDDKN